ncbi:F0F1 ATP synthase subunit gamma [Thermodesulfobacteriota bacterium]
MSVVKTMKSLAAVNIHHFEGAALSLEQYGKTVDMGWRALLRSGGSLALPKKTEKPVCLILGSDQGMCGQFNETIFQAALLKIDELHSAGQSPVLWTAGERIRAALEDDGKKVSEHFILPGSVPGIGKTAEALVNTYEAREGERRVDAFHVMHHRVLRGGGFEPACVQILPLDAAWVKEVKNLSWPGKCLPLIGTEPNQFTGHLFQQHLFVTLYRAFAQSMASENAARLRSMQAAEKNIKELEERLTGLFRQTRQGVITAELLDIISGFESLKDEMDKAS